MNINIVTSPMSMYNLNEWHNVDGRTRYVLPVCHRSSPLHFFICFITLRLGVTHATTRKAYY